jgi:putative endonuclease
LRSVSPRQELGRLGEQEAVRLLRPRGYRVLQRNYRTPFGEIDLIARQGGTLCFIEVKSRRSLRLGTPQESVTSRKQQHLRRAAECYLLGHPHPGPCRFDVVALVFKPDQTPASCEVIENAF